MPLINFKTNFTSLRFGMDQPGGGDSGQPFIQNPIEDANTPTDIKSFYEANRTSLDFPIRGGAISSLVNGSYTTKAAVIDTDRIKKFFNSKPRGTAFIEKQKGLQLSNPKTQVPDSLQFVGFSLNNAVIPVTQVYNPANTLAQVGVQGTGAHFNRHGVNPNLYESVRQTYQYVVGNPENNTETTNRLAILKALKLDRNSNLNFNLNSSPANGVSIDPALVDRLGISTIQSQLFNYPGGPGSNYGIGFTRIFRATDSQGAAISTQPIGNPVTGVAYSSIGLTYAQLAVQDTVNPASPTDMPVRDFREQLTGPKVTGAYAVYNIANPNNGVGGLSIGNPGAPFVHTDYRQNNPNGIDLLNKKNLFYYNASSQTPWDAGAETDGANYTKDIIKFAFECMSNNSPDNAIALVFRAFLEGQISDNNQAEFSSFKYLGRGETFRTYQGFDRTIGFTFKIFPQSRAELRPLYRKLNHLISQIYPDYSPTSNLMRGNVVKLTIGDYLYRVPGFLENVNVSINNTNTSWEIVLNKDEKDVAQLPHVVTVSTSFKPIFDFLPRRENIDNPIVPLIGTTDFLSGSIISRRRGSVAVEGLEGEIVNDVEFRPGTRFITLTPENLPFNFAIPAPQ